MFSLIYSFFAGIVNDKLSKVFLKDVYKRPVYFAVTRGLFIATIYFVFRMILHFIANSSLGEAILDSLISGLMVWVFSALALFMMAMFGRIFDSSK